MNTMKLNSENTMFIELLSKNDLMRPMIADTLKDVARTLGIKEVKGHIHQFDQKVGNQADVNARVDMQR